MCNTDPGQRERQAETGSQTWGFLALHGALSAAQLPPQSHRPFRTRSECLLPVTPIMCPPVQRTQWVSMNHTQRRASGTVERVTDRLQTLDSFQIKRRLTKKKLI